MPRDLAPAPLLIRNPRGALRAMSPTLAGASTPEAVRVALNDARKAGAALAAATSERARAADALRLATEEATRADMDALAAGQDVSPVDREAEAEAALRTADRRLAAAQTLARKASAAVAPAIVAAAGEWLPVLKADLQDALAERTAGEVPSRAYLERVNLYATRYHFVRDVSEGRHPGTAGPAAGRLPWEQMSDNRPILTRAVNALGLIDALLGDYAAGVERAERNAASREREDAERAEWEDKARAEAAREAETIRRAKAERERPEVIR